MQDEIKGTVMQIILGDGWNYMRPILVPSFAKRIATQMLVTEKLNGKKDFVLRAFVCDVKHKNKVWQLLRIKHEDNGVVPVSSLLTVNIFPTCSNCWLWTGIYFRFELPGSYWKDKHFWRVYHVLCLLSTLVSRKRGRNFSNILNSMVVELVKVFNSQTNHCVKVSVFRVILLRIFPAFGLNTDRKYLSVISPNAGKCGPE